ncbi:MAG TPA: hypothetical protein VGD98_24950 [Ktedonobacteraceae bacterium]
MNYHNDDDFSSAEEESGSDELLTADDLRLPAEANVLVRLHAIRAWLNRRYAETSLEVGASALYLQTMARARAAENEARPRRRAAENGPLLNNAQRDLNASQRRLSAYDEARVLLENCVAHTTVSDRLLVEYYLALEERLQSSISPTDTPWITAMQDVMHRVEQMGTPGEDEE